MTVLTFSRPFSNNKKWCIYFLQFLCTWRQHWLPPSYFLFLMITPDISFSSSHFNLNFLKRSIYISHPFPHSEHLFILFIIIIPFKIFPIKVIYIFHPLNVLHFHHNFLEMLLPFNPLCPSVGRLITWSVGRSFSPSVIIAWKFG